MRKRLFRSRSGEGYPMVIAVTLCLLMLFLVIAEYFRVNIIVQGCCAAGGHCHRQ